MLCFEKVWAGIHIRKDPDFYENDDSWSDDFNIKSLALTSLFQRAIVLHWKGMWWFLGDTKSFPNQTYSIEIASNNLLNVKNFPSPFIFTTKSMFKDWTSSVLRGPIEKDYFLKRQNCKFTILLGSQKSFYVWIFRCFSFQLRNF